jgi:hypothetical protein
MTEVDAQRIKAVAEDTRHAVAGGVQLLSHLPTRGFYLSAVKRYVGTIGPISEISG